MSETGLNLFTALGFRVFRQFIKYLIRSLKTTNTCSKFSYNLLLMSLPSPHGSSSCYTFPINCLGEK